jgi:hypothetical protein
MVRTEAARRSAVSWCEEVAGGRVHGTTRQVPREVFVAEEKPHLLPPPVERFDVPTWSQAKVHPDHHVQVSRALYSVPTLYIGRTLDVRLDRSSVRLYAGAELVKIHTRVPAGKRSTDPNDYPRTKIAYALKSVDALVGAARKSGEHVGRFVENLLSGPLPWVRIRQAQALLRLCDRHGAERVNAVCARAIGFDVYEVPRIERLLKQAIQNEEGSDAKGKLVRLPGRFARQVEHGKVGGLEESEISVRSRLFPLQDSGNRPRNTSPSLKIERIAPTLPWVTATRRSGRRRITSEGGITMSTTKKSSAKKSPSKDGRASGSAPSGQSTRGPS